MIMTVQLSTVFSARKLHLIISCKMAPVLDLPVMVVLIPHIFCKALKTSYRKDTGYEIRFYFTPYSQKSHGYEAIITFFCKSLPDHTRCNMERRPRGTSKGTKLQEEISAFCLTIYMQPKVKTRKNSEETVENTRDPHSGMSMSFFGLTSGTWKMLLQDWW